MHRSNPSTTVAKIDALASGYGAVQLARQNRTLSSLVDSSNSMVNSLAEISVLSNIMVTGLKSIDTRLEVSNILQAEATASLNTIAEVLIWKCMEEEKRTQRKVLILDIEKDLEQLKKSSKEFPMYTLHSVEGLIEMCQKMGLNRESFTEFSDMERTQDMLDALHNYRNELHGTFSDEQLEQYGGYCDDLVKIHVGQENTQLITNQIEKLLNPIPPSSTEYKYLSNKDGLSNYNNKIKKKRDTNQNKISSSRYKKNDIEKTIESIESRRPSYDGEDDPSGWIIIGIFNLIFGIVVFGVYFTDVDYGLETALQCGGCWIVVGIFGLFVGLWGSKKRGTDTILIDEREKERRKLKKIENQMREIEQENINYQKQLNNLKNIGKVHKKLDEIEGKIHSVETITQRVIIHLPEAASDVDIGKAMSAAIAARVDAAAKAEAETTAEEDGKGGRAWEQSYSKKDRRARRATRKGRRR